MSLVAPDTARRVHRAAEPIHGMIYFTPHGPAAYAEVGITHPRMTYFASRSAAMGPVPAETVIATFFNFSPAIIHQAIPAAWEIATPGQVLAARPVDIDGLPGKVCELAPLDGRTDLTGYRDIHNEHKGHQGHEGHKGTITAP